MILKIAFIGILSIGLNLLIQGLGSVYWLRKITATFKTKKTLSNQNLLSALFFSFLLFTIIHTVHSFVWALCYHLIPETSIEFSGFSETLYFSLVTFTTLGYGDISLSSDWRLLSGLEAINGIMLIGWSTAMMFSLIQNLYKNIKAN